MQAPAAFEGDDAAAWEAMKSVMSRKPFEAGPKACNPLSRRSKTIYIIYIIYNIIQ